MNNTDSLRRNILKLSATGMGAAAAAAVACSPSQGQEMTAGSATGAHLNVRLFGATGNGSSLDTSAINKAIETASAGGGGIVHFPAGTYLSYSIHLKSNVVLSLDPGSSIVAASVPPDGAPAAGYDAAEPNEPWDRYQDYGHSHWHNSLIWGENIHDAGIVGTGLIWGRGLSRGASEAPLAESPGMGNKAIALKNCHNVLLRDLSILEAGHFAILATGVDSLTVDNVLIDTNRDGIDIDCCRNVRVSNCSVNSPWDDAICPKSSFALGYARSTENVTITNCFVTGAYQLGSMLDGSWKRWPTDKAEQNRVKPYFPEEFNGSIKLGTESNGAFRNITISNCVFEGSKGFALESSDGAIVEGLVLSDITMRDCTNTPIFLRLGSRMRGPAGSSVGRIRGVIISDIVSYNSVSRLGGGGIIAGIVGHEIEDLKIHNVFLEHAGGGTETMAKLQPPEAAGDDPYPDPDMFGDIPASGFYLRHVKNIELSHVEIAMGQLDARPVFILDHVDGADLFRIKTPRVHKAPIIALRDVTDIRVSAIRGVADAYFESAVHKDL